MAPQTDADSAQVAANLADADKLEGMHGTASTAAHSGPEHLDPAAWGMTATAWVSLAMIAVIVLMVWKKVPGIVGRGLDKKIAGIRAQLDEASRLRAEAEALRAEYQAKSAAAAGEAEAIVTHAREEAATIVEQARTNAAALIERRGRMAEDKIGAAERAAIADVRATAARAAATAAASIIGSRHDASADRALVDQTIAGLGTTRLN
ncbi:F0F1 ATP synthase subunit B [Sphingomonas solaris]|uniref:ATP synthase subunit b n=1 Tax=Alterirhizorhabdus solaris TaxID=2529389 RepID=A0A558R7Y9_9SPHN|nr:F0F1 ATP synthase subunit B [Sphingomonas solaris]TVV75500.1 F0F1 ATP synthase subunit B [Sphingomonas solaris]